MREVLEFAAREGLVLMADEVLGPLQVPGQFIDTAYSLNPIFVLSTNSSA